MPKVSVVITVYNSMPYLPETVESVLRQTFDDFEVLIIDDGSTDQTLEWVSQLNHPNVNVITQENQGVSVARNTGIHNSKGTYVAFLDGDDLWEPTKLEKQVILLDQNPDIGLVHTWLAPINEQGQPTGRVMTCKADGNVWERMIESNMVACSAAVVRRSCFEAVGVFDADLRFAEDWDMWIRVADRYSFAVVKEPLVQYRLHANSKSKKYATRLQDFHKIIEKAFQTVPFELLYLRNRSYGHINMCIAWKCIQGIEKDYEKANYFCRQALLHCPGLRYSKEYLRLRFAIAAMRWFGVHNYSNLLNLLYALQRGTSSITRAFTSYNEI
jgi:glycosyltransferase involved in cell wall biosynthesis